jgi:hypothetical protein
VNGHDLPHALFHARGLLAVVAAFVILSTKATRLRDPTDASADTAREPLFGRAPYLKKHEVPAGLAVGLLLEP